MTKLKGLWLGKLGNANSWYHIYPFAMAHQTDELHIVRHKPPYFEVPKSVLYPYKERNKFLDCITMYRIGAKIIKKYDISYIVTFNPAPYGSVAWLLARIYKKPIVIGLIGTDFNVSLKKRLYGRLLLGILRNTDYVTITGRAMRPYLESKGLPSNKIGIYPHCIIDNWFETEHKKVFEYDLITASWLNSGKRIQDIIEAVYILKQKGLFLKLIILGDGVERDFLEDTIDKLNLKDQVEMPGYKEDMLTYFKKSKIYVQASEFEGLSISLIEAMALGIVPVATRAGSEEDIIEDGINGFLINIGKPDEIASAVEKLCDIKVYEKMKQQLFNTRDRFRISNAIKAAENIIETITNS